MKHLASSLFCLGLSMPALTATSITYVGKETGSTVQNWSNPGVAKTQDLNGNDRFGGAGYYQITPGPIGLSYSEDVPDGNDLGIATSNPTRGWQPGFLTEDPAGAMGTFLNFDYFPQFYDPAGTTLLQQGVLWLSRDIQEPGTGPGNAEGTRSRALSFVLSEPVGLRIGIAVDTMDDGAYAPDYVSISNVITGEVFSAAIVRDGVPDMVFFDIVGGNGQEFEVALWQTDWDLGADNRVAFALVTFDQPPNPTLTYVQEGDNFILSWEQNIPGWILESSTDLGATDAWDPVPGVENNSVSVPMTGVPQNFFRLRKNL